MESDGLIFVFVYSSQRNHRTMFTLTCVPASVVSDRAGSDAAAACECDVQSSNDCAPPSSGWRTIRSNAA